jgi:hypothetical protein
MEESASNAHLIIAGKIMWMVCSIAALIIVDESVFFGREAAEWGERTKTWRIIRQ